MCDTDTTENFSTMDESSIHRDEAREQDDCMEKIFFTQWRDLINLLFLEAQ